MELEKVDFLTEIDSLRRGWQACEARLAVAEAERDAARAKRDAARAEVAHMKREQQAMIMQHRHDIRDLGHLLQDERCKVAAVEAERDAARAGEARAVEFASTVKSTIEESLEWAKQDPEVAIELLKDLMNQADGIGYAHELGNALAWLAQQRAEAVEAERRANTDVIRLLGPAFCDFFFGGPGEAEYLAGLLRQQRREAAAEENDRLAGEWWAFNDEYIASELSARAAALRAGEAI